MKLDSNADVDGFSRIVLDHPSGSRVELCRQGAHVTSWKNARGEELLFLSRKSWFAPSRPIRGGIPIVFPQFCDDGSLPKHGFARTSQWVLADSGQTSAGDVFATLRLEADADTLRLWPFRFSLEYSVLLSDRLTLRLTTTNTGDLPFRFQTALHTYFQVADIRRVGVLGLQGLEFSDSLRAGLRQKESRELVNFTEETDRIYIGAPDALAINNDGPGRTFRIAKSGLADVVVWNPWLEKSRCMEDFGDEEYQSMLCVETGNIMTPVALNPSGRWEGSTTFFCEGVQG